MVKFIWNLYNKFHHLHIKNFPISRARSYIFIYEVDERNENETELFSLLKTCVYIFASESEVKGKSCRQKVKK